jgi:chemotaxis protein CheD
METITIGIAEAEVSNNPNCGLVTHALGSCVAVAIYDAEAKVAGLLHIMLPESSIDREKAKIKPFTYADTGIPALFRAAYAKGADKKRITVYLVGGAQVMDPGGVFNIGKRNHLACRKVLWAAGVMVHGEEVGGNISRTVSLEVASGRLRWHSGGGPPQEMPVKSPARGSLTQGGVTCPSAS